MHKRLSICIPVAVLALNACSGEGTFVQAGPGASDSEPAALESIVEIPISDTRRIAIHEPRPGVLLASESGSIAWDRDSKLTSFESAESLYRQLVGEGADPGVLEQLRAADQRAEARRLELARVAPPLEGEFEPRVGASEMIDKHTDFLDGSMCQRTSFEGGYCAPLKFNQILSSTSGWSFCTSHFRSTVFNHQYTSSSGSAIHKVFYWGDRGDFWDEVASTWVPRGTWQSWHSTWRYVKATTDRAYGLPGNHDQCVLKRPYERSLIDFTGCDVVVAC